MISNNAYYELFASYTVPDHNRVGYWVDLGANSKGKVIKTYNENLKKWVKVTDATSEDAVAPFIGNNGNWWIDNRDTGIHASGHSPYIGHNGNWFVHSSERNEHIDTGLPSRGEAGPKGDKGDKGNDATINGVGSIKIEAGDNITITQSDDTLTIIGDVQKPDLSNYATKTEVTKLDNKLQDAVSSVFRAKGSVKTYNNLPVDKVSIGDVYNVLDTGANYVAISINPITWDKLSETVDLSKFFNKEEINSLLSTKVDKQEGKQLTTEDFTTVLKRKLEGLSNYNDTEIRNAIDSLESAFNTLVEGNATVAIDTFNEIVSFLKNIENSQDLDSIIAGINTTISKVEAKIPDTNNFLSKDGGTMNNTNLVGNLNAELLNGYSSDKFVSIINHIQDSTTTDASTVGLNTINQDYLWTNTPYGDIATLVDISYSPDWRSLFFISPSTGRIHTRFKHNGDTWTNWKEIAFTDGSVANADMLDGLHIDEFLIKGPRVYSKEDFDTKYRFASIYSTDYMSPVNGAYNYGQVLSFVDNCSTTQFYCPDNTGLIYFRNSWGTDSKGSENFANIPWYEIITSKSIGSQTVESAKKIVPRYITNLNTDGINEFFSSGFRANNRPSNENYATGFTVYNSELAYTYQFTFNTYGYVYTRYKNKTEWQPWYEIITSKNIGSQTVANSYMLNSLQASEFSRYGDYPSESTNNWDIQSGIYKTYNALPNFPETPYTHGHFVLHANFDINTAAQLLLYGLNRDAVYYRRKVNQEWLDWKRLAFTTDTVAAANKLSTTRYLWGQPFDGSGNVKGVIKGVPYVSFETYDYEGGSAGYVGRGGTNSNDLSITTYGENSIEFFTNSLERMRITKDGRVGIGTLTPVSKLHVVGRPIFNHNEQHGDAGLVIIRNDASITGWDRAIFAHYPNLEAGAHANFHIGKANSEKNGGYISYYHAGDSSGNNCMTIGLYATDDILNVTANRRVGINTTTPQEALDVNGNIRAVGYARLTGDVFINSGTSSDNNNAAGKLFFGGSNSTDHGVYLSATKYDTYGRKRFGIFTTNAASETPNWIESFSITPGGSVGINTTTPAHPLDVNGDAIIRGSLHTIDHILLDGTDQINGKWGGIALNYKCGKYVNTTIWDGQESVIMRAFGEGRQVAIGAHSVDTPRGTLNVDGEVIFEKSRFTTTSGFVDGEYAYSHAIYGGYHGIDVCEFYENEFRFKVNGGSITSLNLTPDDAIFNGIIQTHSCQYLGKFNGKPRFWLGRDGATNTWLQAATDTSNEGGRLYMSGYNGTTLSEFKVYASNVTCTGNILANGDVTAYSDIRLKNRIESVNNVLDTIDTLDVFRYTWKNREDKSVHIGVSAQQVQTIYPEFVLTSNSEDGTDYLTVNYAALATCIAIQGIKELVKKGDERDKRIAALEEEVISLKEQLRYGNK